MAEVLFLDDYRLPTTAFGANETNSQTPPLLSDENKEYLMASTADKASRAGNALLTFASVIRGKGSEEKFDAAYQLLIDQGLDDWLPPAVAVVVRSAVCGGPILPEDEFISRLGRVSRCLD
jgi:hypothetical protein